MTIGNKLVAFIRGYSIFNIDYCKFLMKNILIIILVCLSFSLSGAETNGNIYWIQLNTKAGTPFNIDQPKFYLSQRAIERRAKHGIQIDSTDLPANPLFIDSLRSLGFSIKHTSRWMNGITATFNDTIDIDSLDLPSFVSFIELRKSTPLKSTFLKTRNKFDEIDSLTESYYGNSTDQITMLNGQLLHKYSKGEGVQIAVIDAGFLNADKLEVFDSLYTRGGVLGTYDFVNPGNNVYNEHSHGTNVLSILAANHPGKLIGSAPGASYWLLRSENALTEFEYPVEEDYWVVAAEFADSVGCDVISTSLGYNLFKDSTLNHTYGEFTGDSMRISKAANMAVKKGIVVVCSAGNEGDDPWHHIVTPSEARDVLSIAAVDNQREIANFSSRGFGDSALIPKPDVAAMGSGTSIISSTGSYSKGSGTSFSAPIIAGMAACMVAVFPDSSASTIIDMIRKAGNLYPGHSDDYGYGIPDFGKYNDMITVSKNDFALVNSLTIFPNPFDSYLFIQSRNEIKNLDIFSADGHKVFSACKGNQALQGNALSLPNLTIGIYFAVVRNQNSIQTIKLIKK
jgi:serine protease AprX